MKDPADRIRREAHEAAKALHRVGAMDDVTMREMDELCLPPVAAYDPSAIRRIRDSTGMSQPVFARLMGVGKSAVAQWEQGERKPSGPALRLLEVFDREISDNPVLLARDRQDHRHVRFQHARSTDAVPGASKARTRKVA